MTPFDAPATTDAVERALLGSLMLLGRETAWGRVSTIVKPDQFHREANRLIFEAILEVAKTADPDMVLVAAKLDDNRKLETVGGLGYVTGLVDGLPCVDNVIEYAKTIKARAVLRRVKGARI